MEKWEHMSKLVEELPQAKARDLKRFMFSAATIVNPDKQGRVLVSQTLRGYAKMTKDIAVIGASDHVELWDKEAWIELSEKINSDDIAAAMDEIGF
jgi:MraZ protein